MTPLASPPDQVRAQLDKILGSAAFAASTRLQRFLRYVVGQSLAGKGDELKEYSIGTTVFDRDEQYDPRIDSIVRVEAGRLRSKLDEYYNGAGASDELLIRIPRGTYAPAFEQRQNGQAAALVAPDESLARRKFTWRSGVALLAAGVVATGIAAWRTSAGGRTERAAQVVAIAVLPFAHYSADSADQLLAARLTDGVTGELARFGTLGVVSHTSALQFEGTRKPLKEIAKALNADMVVEASMDANGEAVRVQVRLVDAAVDRKSWIQDIEGTRTALPDLQRRIAKAIEADALSRRPR